MFNKKDYKHLKKDIIANVEKRGIESVSEFAALTGIPLIVQYEFIMEEMPEYTDHCEKGISQIKEFLGL